MVSELLESRHPFHDCSVTIPTNDDSGIKMDLIQSLWRQLGRIRWRPPPLGDGRDVGSNLQYFNAKIFQIVSGFRLPACRQLSTRMTNVTLVRLSGLQENDPHRSSVTFAVSRIRWKWPCLSKPSSPDRLRFTELNL